MKINNSIVTNFSENFHLPRNLFCTYSTPTSSRALLLHKFDCKLFPWFFFRAFFYHSKLPTIRQKRNLIKTSNIITASEMYFPRSARPRSKHDRLNLIQALLERWYTTSYLPPDIFSNGVKLLKWVSTHIFSFIHRVFVDSTYQWYFWTWPLVLALRMTTTNQLLAKVHCGIIVEFWWQELSPVTPCWKVKTSASTSRTCSQKIIILMHNSTDTICFLKNKLHNVMVERKQLTNTQCNQSQLDSLEILCEKKIHKTIKMLWV